VAKLSGRRRAFLVGAGAALVVASALAWSLARRLPVQQARDFLNAPVEVGDLPPPPAGAPTPAAPASLAAADAAFHEGRYADAAAAYAAVLAADPHGAEAGRAQWQLTRARLRSGDGNGALAAFRDLTANYAGWLGSQAPELRAGLDSMAKGDLTAAEQAFGRFVAAQPGSDLVPMAHALTARIHWARNDPVGTVAAFGRMFASVRDPVPGYGRLAHELERYAAGDPDVAKHFESLAQDGEEGFRDIYQYLAARSLLEQDRFTAAHDALEKLRAQHPDGDFSHIVDLEHAWNLLRNGQAAEALAIFERLEKTPAPASASAFDEFFDLRAELPMGIARCQLALEHWPEAAAAFERALAANPHGIYALENRLALASALEHQGDYARAADVLRGAIAEHPDEPRLWAVRQQLARVESHLPDAR
jgi:outer membrane protein assembly factor BamD (BamD/ComL family)